MGYVCYSLQAKLLSIRIIDSITLDEHVAKNAIYNSCNFECLTIDRPDILHLQDLQALVVWIGKADDIGIRSYIERKQEEVGGECTNGY